MKVQLPKTADPALRTIFSEPDGWTTSVDMVQVSGPMTAEVTLPEGLHEDQVAVVCVGLGNHGKPQGPEIEVKAAMPKPKKAKPKPPTNEVTTGPHIRLPEPTPERTPEPTPAPYIMQSDLSLKPRDNK